MSTNAKMLVDLPEDIQNSMDESGYLDGYVEGPEYNPQGPEAAYRNALVSSFYRDYTNFSRPINAFQRMNIYSYMQQNEADSYVLSYPTRKEPWRNNTRLQTIPEKIDAVVAAVADLNLKDEVRSFSMYGSESDPMADAMEGLLEHAHELNLSQDKLRYNVRSHFIHGTAAESVDWRCMKQARKSLTSKGDYANAEWKDLPDSEDKRIWTSSIPLNRVIPGDLSQPYIWLQPHIWIEYVMDYEVFKSIYGHLPNAKYVRPVAVNNYVWAQTGYQAQIETDVIPRKVYLVVYQNRWRDEMAILANYVLLTKPGLPMPGKFLDKQYSVAWTPLIPVEHLCYGISGVQRMHNDSVLRDFFYNALVDRTRQELEPPVVTSYRNIVNRYMFRPGAITPVGADFKVDRIISDQAGISDSFAMIKFIDENINRISVPLIMQGQQPGQGVTAYQIREQMKNALRTMFVIFSAVAEQKRQVTQLMIRNILEYYPEFGVSQIDQNLGEVNKILKKVFTVKGQVAKSGMQGKRKIGFAKLPENVKVGSALMRGLQMDEEASRIYGTPHKWYLLDPDTMRKFKHQAYVIINPGQRKSKEADKIEAREEYLQLRQDPLINQEKNLAEYLSKTGKNPDEWIQKGQPQPGLEAKAMEGAGPQPGSSPLQGQETKEANLDKAMQMA